MKSFGEPGKAALTPGTVDAKALVKLGASAAEVHETVGVAIYMGGGPSAVYAANAVAAFNEFAAAEAAPACGQDTLRRRSKQVFLTQQGARRG